jgi:signal transduction histidine kinase
LRTEVDLALRRPRDADHLREALSMARAEIERLTALARKLLDFESLRSQPLSSQDEVELGALVCEVTARLSTQASGRDVRIESAIEATGVLSCDPLLVALAVENLLENALRFAPPGSRVRVTVSAVDGSFRCAVEDEGPGIAEDERVRVFEPFYRGTAPESQTGLGLAFVADVAQKHGGRAFVDDAPRGTRVVLELPRRGAA